MKKLLLFSFLVLLVSFITGCEKEREHKTRLAVSPWIGYSPLYYADEMGWLKEAGIKLVHSTSLHETVHYFQADLIDAFVSTQYEVSLINSKDIIHLMPIDRSNGADLILANFPLEEVIKSKNTTVYLEIDSVNQLVFDEFLKKYKIGINNFKLINKAQVEIKNLKPDTKEKIIIVTYEPYASTLIKNGFTRIGSTNDVEMLVLDSLYINKDFFKEHNNQAIKMKEILKKAYKKLQDDPLEYYKIVEHYLDSPTFEEFKNSMNGIEWLIDKEPNELNTMFKPHNILPVGSK